ncbi:MAG: chitobiase/beta-hexosaminidase C-terminal domain-containing protein [Lachnospiraceae bacterium]|nr:chitobiase/beta-hexosaminidase C-terminal domain-containing protein [Lachnospiraceae bacterium]
MKLIKKKFKKGTAMLLAGTMMAGLMTVMPQSAIRVKAAGTAPGVSAYATKEQLMDGTFAPDTNGNATNIGKLVFGKKSDGTTPQEWYILGADSGVTGGTDNTIIFATSPIATRQRFTSSKSNKTYNYEAGTGYGDTAGNIEVYANHYGASDLRVALQTMATNTSYFTTAEQGLMNPTTVTTNDTKNKDSSNNDLTYTTTDKLYALSADGYSAQGYETIKAGSNNQTVLARNSYWSFRSGNGHNSFWLRLPKPSHGDSEGAIVEFTEPPLISPCPSTAVYSIRPASNLNLSSVLFASAASSPSSGVVASGTITSGTAMALRLDGSGMNIGSVTYNTTTGDIKAVKGSTSQTVALVVQGNDGTNNWYYSKKIDASETINAADIKSALNLSSDIDLSACKIWLETTVDNVAYAVQATERTTTDISSVEITGIDAPTANTALDTEAVCATTEVSSATPTVTWTPSDTIAGYNTGYTASIILTAATGYEFTDSTIATVLGNNATSVTKNGDGTLTVTYAFSATDKDKLISITAPQPITVANGTAYGGMNLPATVTIETEGNTVTTATVTWDTSAPASGSYDPAVLTEQTVTLNGTVDCPADLDANGVSLTTTLTITISAAGIVGAPTVTPAAGIYTQNQSAALVSSTEGAELYYTTDGSEPALAGGMPTGTTMEYTAPIAVTGTQGQSVTTTIRAIAVKEGMQNSSVQTFTYTINLAMPKHTITATAGANGRISPAGMVEVTEGNDQLFTITAEEGYEIAALKVDNAEVSVMSSYTFTGVRADHTIAVTFKQKDTPVQPVEAPAITAQPQNTTVGAGEPAVLTVMENTAPAPARVNYEILDGANGSWVLNSDGSLSIRGSGEFSKFVGVRVDGTLIDTTNYTAREGSTIITLEAAYLNTLSVGTHTFELIWTDGSANTTVTINANASRNSALPGGTNKKDDVPKTGDSTPMAGLFILAGLSGAGLIFTGGKGRKNPEASGE